MKNYKLYGLGVLAFITTTLLSACGNNKVKLTQNIFKIELGSSEISEDATDYISSETKDIYKYSVDTSNVNTDKVGDYEIIISGKGKKIKAKAKVVDTTAPEVERSKDSAFLINGDTQIDVDFTSYSDESIFDISKIKDFGFTAPEKIAEDFNFDDIRLYRQESNGTLKSIPFEITKEEEILSKKFTIQENGVYDVSLVAIDEYGNASKIVYRFFVDANAPEIDAKDLYVDITYIKNKFMNTVYGYEADKKKTMINDKDGNVIETPQNIGYANYTLKSLERTALFGKDNMANSENLFDSGGIKASDISNYDIEISECELINKSDDINKYKTKHPGNYNFFDPISEEYEQAVTITDKVGNKSTVTRKIYIKSHCEEGE